MTSWPHFSHQLRVWVEAAVLQTSSRQISLTAHQIKYFLRFRFYTCCRQLPSMWPKGTWACVPWLNGDKPALCWPLNSDSVVACDSSTCCRKEAKKVADTVTCAWPHFMAQELEMRKQKHLFFQRANVTLFNTLCVAVSQLNQQHFGPFDFHVITKDL